MQITCNGHRSPQKGPCSIVPMMVQLQRNESESIGIAQRFMMATTITALSCFTARRKKFRKIAFTAWQAHRSGKHTLKTCVPRLQPSPARTYNQSMKESQSMEVNQLVPGYHRESIARQQRPYAVSHRTLANSCRNCTHNRRVHRFRESGLSYRYPARCRISIAKYLFPWFFY